MADSTWSTQIGQQNITLTCGILAERATGAVLVTAGGTVILATAVISDSIRADIDYFPLVVDYEERLYAAGKIKGSRWVKREGRPSDEAILTARLVDRSIRPLFPKDFYNDIQVILTVLSYDEENDPVVLSILAASAALMRAGAPILTPIAGARVGKINDQFVVSPSRKDLEQSSLDLIVSATPDRVLMIEADGAEIPEAEMIKAIKLAQQACQQAIEIQAQLQGEPFQVAEVEINESIPTLRETVQAVKTYTYDKIWEISQLTNNKEKDEQLKVYQTEVVKMLKNNHPQENIIKGFEKINAEIVRQRILEDEARPDGRSLDEIRPLFTQVGLLPRTHGSGLFIRGQTQSLTIVTLGAPGEVQMIETMEEEGEKRYMHHYNFPPFSTGEAKPIRATSRREIGHGALAERALIRLIPSKEDFPYTIRLVSEILSSNGSSSMAATCASTLALMDAGVPIKKPVAGIAIGLMTKDGQPDNYKILTDIAGREDMDGDMDFKVAGTDSGVTAIQMDTKIAGLTEEMIETAFDKAKTARRQILAEISKTIPEPRAALSQYAPRITALKINPLKIGELIGPGGKTITKIIEECGGREIMAIDIEDDGTVMVSSTDSEMSKKAITMIEGITREVEVGEIFDGEVIQIIKDRNNGKDIGAIVQILPNKEGMVHISEISPQRIERISDVLKLGQTVKVKVVGIDLERGRIQLSIKALLDR